MLILLAAGVLSASEARKIALVCQQDSSQYIQAKDAFVAAVKEAEVRVIDVSLSVLTDETGINYADYDQVVVIGSRAAYQILKTIPRGTPIAYCMVYSPEKIGLATDSHNYGVSLRVSISDQIELINKVCTKTDNIVTIISQSQAGNKSWPLSEWPDTPELRTIIVPDEIENSQREGHVKQLISLSPDIVWTYPDSNTFHSITMKIVLLESIKRRIPVFGYSENVVKAGALLGVTVEPEDQGKQLAEMLIKDVKGEALSNKHITARCRPVFNLAVAKILGINIPEELLAQARYLYGK